MEYTVRSAKKEDMVGAHELCMEQGWNVSLQYLEFHTSLFPEGAFVAESSTGEILSACASVCLDESNAFVAYYVTKVSCRGQGIGRKVFDLSMAAVGGRNVGLNSAWDKQNVYAKGGFAISTFIMDTYNAKVKDIKIKQEKSVDNDNSTGMRIVDVKNVDLNDILKYDEKISPIKREKNIHWLMRVSTSMLAAVDNENGVLGFGSLYRAEHGYRLMPVYADSPKIARAIIEALISNVSPEDEADIEVLMPADNEEAKRVYKELGVISGEEGFRSRRMFTKRDVPVPTHLCYSIMNYENVLI